MIYRIACRHCNYNLSSNVQPSILRVGRLDAEPSVASTRHSGISTRSAPDTSESAVPPLGAERHEPEKIEFRQNSLQSGLTAVRPRRLR